MSPRLGSLQAARTERFVEAWQPEFYGRSFIRAPILGQKSFLQTDRGKLQVSHTATAAGICMDMRKPAATNAANSTIRRKF